MGGGLSDRRRRRMERERERVQRRMAEERERIQPRMAAERERIQRRMAEERERIQPRLAAARADAELDARHRERFGPKVVTGPDGLRVRLEVVTTGTGNWSDPPPSLRGMFGTSTQMGYHNGFRLFMRRGFALWISASGIAWRDHRYFTRDEDTAAALLLGAAQEVEEGGMPALRAWAQRRHAERRWR